MKIRELLLLLIILPIPAKISAQKPERPKLVVGIVVDQMRYDYLYRFKEKLIYGGFSRLVNDGFNCRNTNYNYVPTYTGPGHASIYTGSVPALHGIVANDWYDRNLKDTIYCVQDPSVESVGGKGKPGKMSPKNLWTSTITDELKLATNFKSKTFGIALKDRGAILPAGHIANAAFWFDSLTGGWISSSFYGKELAGWVKEFNDKKMADAYLAKTWNTTLPIKEYTESDKDDVPYEKPLKSSIKPAFPYDLSKIKGTNYELLKATPYGNTFTKDFAKALIANENLGKGEATDFLALSFSSTDYIGHYFGPNSVEVEDTYLRLDKDLNDFFSFLDSVVGPKNYLLFLTADHGAAHVPGFLKEARVPAGVVNGKQFIDSLGKYLNKEFHTNDLIRSYYNQQIYLGKGALSAAKINEDALFQKIRDFSLGIPGIAGVNHSKNLYNTEFNEGIQSKIKNGLNPKRSGDIIITLQPGWIEGKKTGTTHGEGYSYDTHVPLLWYGWHIPKGESAEPVEITDITPTLSYLLKLENPNGCVGRIIKDVINPK